MTDYDREMIQFARSYHSAFVDQSNGELLNEPQTRVHYYITGDWTLTQGRGYRQAIQDILAAPIEIADG